MRTISVKGMSCPHCVKSVTQALEKIEGVSQVKVDLATGKASFEEAKPVPAEVLKQAITKIGFEVEV
jgi:copper chaperone